MAVAQISCTLYGCLLQAPEYASLFNVPLFTDLLTRLQAAGHLDIARENLGSILGYMTPYFPFRSNGRDIKVCSTLWQR